MSAVPHPFAAWTIFKGNITSVDYLHLVQESDGSIPGWIDQSGYPQGTLAAILSINGSLITSPNLIAGANITLAVSGSNITISSSGGGGGGGGFDAITSGTNTQAAMLVGTGASLGFTGSGVVNANEINNVLVTGAAINGQVLTATGAGAATWQAPGATTLPWFDIQNYGGHPRNVNGSVTTATTSTNSPNVTLGSAMDFVNGNGLVIFGVGTTVTSISNPNFVNPPSWAPVATPIQVPALQGSSTFNYAIIGVDSGGALSPVSLPVTTTVGPNNFNSVLGTILSASTSGGTLSILISGVYTIAPGNAIMVSGFTGAGAPFNNIWTVATVVPGANTAITITGTGLANALGPINGFQTLRITNIQKLTSLARIVNPPTTPTSVSVLTAVTAGTSGMQAGTSTAPVIGIISGATPSSEFLGWYPITGVNAGTNTITLASNRTVSITETATLGSQAFLTVFEYVQLNLPPTSGTGALAYYIYADYTNSGNYTLIGKSMPNQQVFFDYGAFIRSGFSAPLYVPTSLTSSSGVTPTFAGRLNQNYSGTIVTGGGSTSLTVSPNVPNGVTNAVCGVDDAACFRLAAAAAVAAGGGYVFLSPSSSVSTDFYHFNTPLTVPNQVGVQQGAGVNLYEPLGLSQSTWISAPGSQGSVTPQFSGRNYAQVTGIASPMFNVGNSVYIEGITFRDASAGSNGQYGVFSSAYYFKMKECSIQFKNPASVPLVYCGNGGVTCSITDCDFSSSGIVGNTVNNGQPPYHPHNLPAMWIRGQDNGNNGEPLTLFSMNGNNSFAGKGILLDSTVYAGTSSNFNYTFDCYENQAPVQPFLMTLGSASFSGVTVKNVVMDSSTINAVANWNANASIWTLDSITMSNANFPVITGNIVKNLTALNIFTSATLGQNTNFWSLTTPILSPVFSAQPGNYGLVREDRATQLQNVASIYGAITPPVISSVTSTSTGGTIPAGTYNIYITVHGWNDGEGCWSLASTITTTGSTSTITATWTGGGGSQGCYVYAGLVGNTPQKVQTSSTTAGTLTFTAVTNHGDPPSMGVDGTGIPLIDAGTQVASPVFRTTNGYFKNDVTAPTLSANRTTTLADGAGSVAISGSFTTTAAASDTVSILGVTSSSHVSLTPTNAIAAAMIAAGTVYVSSVSAGSVTVTHSSTSGGTFHIVCTVN